MGPVVAAAGTVAWSWVEETTCVLAATPLNRADENTLKPAPLIVTVAPGGPLVGEKPEIVNVTVKLDALVAVSPGVVTAIGPVVAPFGTVACSVVSETTEKAAASPPNLTVVAEPRFVPLIDTTVEPAAPEAGLKLEIEGPGPGPPPPKLTRCTAPSPRAR